MAKTTMTFEQMEQAVQGLGDEKCPVCNDKPLIKCPPASHGTRTNEYGDCYWCCGEGKTMCPCQG